MTGFYPNNITRRCRSPKRAGRLADANASGRAVSFVCGVSMEFSLRIQAGNGIIDEAAFTTNGCGYATAAGDILAELVTGRPLTGLHGLEDLSNEAEAALGPIPGGRGHCLRMPFDALKSALAEYRAALVDEWTGEAALICTCFGVSEDAIERAVTENGAAEESEVGRLLNAGTGCGSCRMLIREIIDSVLRSRDKIG